MNSTFIANNNSMQDISMTSDGDNPEGQLTLKDTPSPSHNITERKKTTDDLFKELKNFQSSTHAMLDKWFSKQDDKFSLLVNEFENLKTSISFVNKQYEDLKQDTQNLTKQISSLEVNMTRVEQHDSQISQLEAKIDLMEQQARQTNIEINNLPEKKNENLLSVIIAIGDLVKFPVTQRDIVAVHRVPHANANTRRPKNVVVKFVTRVVRDNFISAARTAKKITSDKINISGTTQRIYVNEHLTLKNKMIFRETREVAKQKGFKFVWVKHGVVLVRASETSPVQAVRNAGDITKLKDQTT